MINVQQISNYLARLQPDSAVQKYAALHKDDPYIMALALSEANRRKAAKTAQHLNAPEQPKVVDQAVASMAAPMPEDVGIAQLPTGEMEYAAGGIVAFDEGGEVPRFNGATGSLAQSAAQFAASDIESPAEKARRLLRMAQARAAFSGKIPFSYGLTPGAAAAGLGVATIPFGIAGGLTSAMDYMREQGYPTGPDSEFATGPTPEQLAFDEARRQGLLRERAAQTASTVIPTSATPAAAAAKP